MAGICVQTHQYGRSVLRLLQAGTMQKKKTKPEKEGVVACYIYQAISEFIRRKTNHKNGTRTRTLVHVLTQKFNTQYGIRD